MHLPLLPVEDSPHKPAQSTPHAPFRPLMMMKGRAYLGGRAAPHRGPDAAPTSSRAPRAQRRAATAPALLVVMATALLLSAAAAAKPAKLAQPVGAAASKSKPQSCWKASRALKAPISLSRQLARRSPEIYAALRNATGFPYTLFIPTNKAITGGLANLTHVNPTMAAVVFNGTKAIARKAIARAPANAALSLFRAHTLSGNALLELPASAATAGIYLSEAGTALAFEAGARSLRAFVPAALQEGVVTASILRGPVACAGGLLYAVDAILVPPLPATTAGGTRSGAAAAADMASLPDLTLQQVMSPEGFAMAPLAANEMLCLTPVMWENPTCYKSLRRVTGDVAAVTLREDFPGLSNDYVLQYTCPQVCCNTGLRVARARAQAPSKACPQPCTCLSAPNEKTVFLAILPIPTYPILAPRRVVSVLTAWQPSRTSSSPAGSGAPWCRRGLAPST
jgi:hypothetical protein